MAGKLLLSTVDQIFKRLKRSRKELVKLAKELPDEDAFATPYSVLIDGINGIDELLRDLKPALKDAKQYRKQNPEQFPNRAKNWCVINDSRRKQSAGTEDAPSADEEAGRLRLDLHSKRVHQLDGQELPQGQSDQGVSGGVSPGIPQDDCGGQDELRVRDY